MTAPKMLVPGVRRPMDLEGSEFLAAEFYGLYIILLLVSFFLSHCLAHRWRRCVYLSEAGLSLLTGFVGGGLLELAVFEDSSDRFGEQEVEKTVVGFSSTVLFCVLLPPIIFDSGFKMRGAFFWANIDKISMLAFAGTFVSSIVVGALLVAASDLLVLPGGEGAAGADLQAFSYAEALAFGALISATDPVATLAIFEQLGVDPHLFNIVFGESVLNDAVSIVLFHTFSKRVGYEGGDMVSLVKEMLVDFIVVFAGSAFLGFCFGCLSALLFKHVQLHSDSDGGHGPKLELAIFLVFCYAPFLFAECAGLSGTVAILFTGTSMKRYTYNNLSESARQAVSTLVSLLAYVAETMIFVDLGTSAWKSFRASVNLVLWVLLACLVARAAHVYPIGWLLNSFEPKYPRRRFESNDMHMVWFSGLRGAIAYALSTQFPGPHRRCVMSMTMWVVLVSVWLMGGATVPVLKWLRVRRCEPDQLKQLSLTLEPAVNRLLFVLWDRQFIYPLLVRDGFAHAGIESHDTPEVAQADELESARSGLRMGLFGTRSPAAHTAPEGTAQAAG